jgi:phosphoketolase
MTAMGTHAPELEPLDAFWRAANYLSVGQIYLLDNPLLREPLRLEHVKPRLLGHWGTTPGLNLLYPPHEPPDPGARPAGAVRHRARARRPPWPTSG